MDKPKLDQGPDYERGFIDGMMYQTETTVNKAVDAMSQRTWVGLTEDEIKALASWWPSYDQMPALMVLAKDIQNSLKEKNA